MFQAVAEPVEWMCTFSPFPRYVERRLVRKFCQNRKSIG
jgi:hypothetical protein